MAAARHIELNPFRAGLVRVPWEYEWSCALFHTGIAERDPLVKDRSLLGLSNDWRKFLGNAVDESFEELRLKTRTGRPAGDDAFIATVEKLTGRNLRLGKPGRPRKRSEK